jgi:hypothetical protein
VSRTFNKEMTIYLWPKGHFKYPKGHAALKASDGGASVSVNFGETSEGVDHQRRNIEQRDKTRAIDDRARNLLRQQSGQDNKLLFQTALRKLKLPFLGSDSPWGLILWELQDFERRAFRQQHEFPSSCSYVADQLHAIGAASYVPPHYETYKGTMWDPFTLEQWVMNLQARIDDLNRKNKELMTMIERNINVRNRSAVTHLMTSDEWKELSNRDMGGSIIRSDRIRKLDKLVAMNQKSARNVTLTVRVLAEMMDIITDYMAQRRDSMRSNAVMALGKQVIEVVNNGCRDYRIANRDPYKPGKQYYGELAFDL